MLSSLKNVLYSRDHLEYIFGHCKSTNNNSHFCITETLNLLLTEIYLPSEELIFCVYYVCWKIVNKYVWIWMPAEAGRRNEIFWVKNYWWLWGDNFIHWKLNSCFLRSVNIQQLGSVFTEFLYIFTVSLQYPPLTSPCSPPSYSGAISNTLQIYKPHLEVKSFLYFPTPTYTKENSN